MLGAAIFGRDYFGGSPVGGAAPLTVGCGSLPSGVVGVAYSSQLTLNGGEPPYTVAIVALFDETPGTFDDTPGTFDNVPAGALPDGLSIDDTGLISGVPTASGTFTFTIGVQDSASPPNSASVVCSITILSLITLSCENPPAGLVGVPYSHQMLIADGTAPYTVTADNLPAGLSISDTGLVTGTPTTAWPYLFTVEVEDSASPPNIGSVSCRITIRGGGLVLVCGNLPVAKPGVPYSAQLTISGGTPPYTVTVLSGPAWLSIDDTGAITGTPLLSSDNAIVLVLQVVDSSGSGR